MTEDKIRNVVWSDLPANWLKWSETERANVEGFLRTHGIDPADVQIHGGNEMYARLLDDGSFELTVWVVDREDGKMVRCPTCPGCVRQRKATVPVTTSLPMTHTTWVAKTVTIDEPEVTE